MKIAKEFEMEKERKHRLRFWLTSTGWTIRLRLRHLPAWQLNYRRALALLQSLYTKAVHDDTGEVIESFPQSANTLSRSYTLELAAKGQISRAVRYQIPCFVIVRHPLDIVRVMKTQDILSGCRTCVACAWTSMLCDQV